jgi:TonB family protein
VQFTVDERGYVVDAKILRSCPYSALNDEALRTVRRFRAKPGVRATTSQPIIFKLN